MPHWDEFFSKRVPETLTKASGHIGIRQVFEFFKKRLFLHQPGVMQGVALGGVNAYPRTGVID